MYSGTEGEGNGIYKNLRHILPPISTSFQQHFFLYGGKLFYFLLPYPLNPCYMFYTKLRFLSLVDLKALVVTESFHNITLKYILKKTRLKSSIKPKFKESDEYEHLQM